MLRVRSLHLPDRLPCSDAIRSFGDNLHSYEPEFWEFQYQVYRYLERVTDALLEQRYKDICRNMKTLISGDRDVIPIQSFLSSWYWFRKEHQTRLEYALRGVSLPVVSPQGLTFNSEATGAPVRPSHPNAGDVLFRYDERTIIEKLAQAGQVRIRPASCKQEESDKARNDEERWKRPILAGAHTRITTQGGRDIPILGDVVQTVFMPDYYMFCMSCDWNPELFTDFHADACIVIKDADLFARRIEIAGAAQLPGWYFHHNPVEYFDPYERLQNEYFDPAMSKDFRFAYQREYRFLWFPQIGGAPEGFKNLELGGLGNLADVIFKDAGIPQQDAPADPPQGPRV